MSHRHPLSNILDRPVAYHRCLVDVAGSVAGAVFLSQALYWQARATNPDGWWWHTQQEFEEETGLSRHEQDTVRSRLRQQPWYEDKLRGMPARMHYRIDLDQLAEILLERSQSSLPKPGELDCRDPANKAAVSCQTCLPGSGKHNKNRDHTETTSETTTTLGGGLDWSFVRSQRSGEKARAAERAAIERALSAMPSSLRQDVLDELAAAQREPAGVTNPAGFVRGCAAKGFAIERGLTIRHAREQRRTEVSAPYAPRSPRQTSAGMEAGRAALLAMKKP